MVKVPRIIVTNVDEDPSIRKEMKRKKITELCGKFLIHFGVFTLKKNNLSFYFDISSSNAVLWIHG